MGGRSIHEIRVIRVIRVKRLLDNLEIVFAYAAEGANPVVGDIFKRGTRLDAAFGVSNGGVILPAAYFTNIFIHKLQKIID